jgi:hypothetical protein
MTFRMAAVPAQDPALWRSPWDGAVSGVVTASYVLLPDGRVLGVASRSQNNNPNTMTLGHAPSVSAFLGGDGSMTVDRVLVTATGGSSTARRIMSAGLCFDPDDPTKLLLLWGKVADNATWTYGSGFPTPSVTNANEQFIYESADYGVTWTEKTKFGHETGSTQSNPHGNGPIQKFGSLYLMAAVTNQNRRHIFSSTDKITWTHRYADNSTAGVGAGIGYRDGKFYVWGMAGLASSSDGLSWTRYDTSVTDEGGPWFTFSLDGGATVKHGVIRRKTSSISSALLWQSSTTVDPVPADFTTETDFDNTGYSNPAGWQPLLSVLGRSHLVIVNGPRVFPVELLYGGWSVGSFRLG